MERTFGSNYLIIEFCFPAEMVVWGRRVRVLVPRLQLRAGETVHAECSPFRGPCKGAQAPEIRPRRPRRKAQSVWRPGTSFRRQTFLHPHAASRPTCLEDRRRRQRHERGRGANACRVDAGRNQVRRGCLSVFADRTPRSRPSQRPCFSATPGTGSPRTLYVNRSYSRRQLLPWFAGRQISDIDRARRSTLVRVAPGNASRGGPVDPCSITDISRKRSSWGTGLKGSNPCRAMKRYRRQGPRAVPVRRGNRPNCGEACRTCG